MDSENVVFVLAQIGIECRIAPTATVGMKVDDVAIDRYLRGIARL